VACNFIVLLAMATIVRGHPSVYVICVYMYACVLCVCNVYAYVCVSVCNVHVCEINTDICTYIRT